MRHRRRIVPPLAENIGDLRNLLCRVLGDGRTGPAGAQRLRVVEHRTHDLNVARLPDRFQGNLMDGGHGAGEVRPHDDPVHIAENQ